MTGEGSQETFEEPATDTGESTPDPGLFRRLVDTIFSPGRMAEAVAARPRWFGALAVAAILIAISMALLPVDLMMEMQRQAVLERGGTPQEMTDTLRTIMRWGSILGAGIGFVVFAFIGAGINTVIFAFILGDEGTYKQYLALGVHTAIIPALAAVLLAPLRIATEDPQLTLSLGTFAAAFMEPSYLLNVLRAFDLMQIWAICVSAVGLHAIDARRTFASGATILLVMMALIALAVGAIMPT